ncbi:MAG: hypothetical protein ACLQG5_10585 [Methanobacterium sp.]|jgi:hypothetical protein
MRHSYGIMDERKILLYKPHLFLKGNDLLVFPSKDFHKWHGDIKEYIDGLYQINSINLENGKSININDLNLVSGLLTNITEELEHLFDSKRLSDFSFHYVSTLDEEYTKRRENWYTSDMMKCDMRIPVKPSITPWIQHQNMMEIIDQSAKEFTMVRRKKSKELTDPSINEKRI